jgi:branched-chain amino acid transport system ATP-binding protein
MAEKGRRPDDRPPTTGAGAPALPERGGASAPPLLEVRDLHAGYRDVPVLRGISLTVGAGEIVALVGANGAGKTTTLRAIAGLLAPSRGEIHFGGARIDGAPAHEVVARGLVLTPEGRKIFPSLTVRENLDLGGYLPGARSRREASRERVMGLFPILRDRQRQPAGTLSGGEQQMLAIARSLMSEPRLLMLDEPSLGLAPLIVDRILDVIQAINRDGTPVLLVEQNVHRALALATRAYVLEQGAVTLTGAGPALAAREDVRRAYLGL